MRSDLIPLSASALVVGVMSLLLASALSLGGGTEGAEALQVVEQQSARWLGMALMYVLASVAMTLGLPALLSVFDDKGRRLGALAVGVFAVGVIGTAGFGMLLVLVHALLRRQVLVASELSALTQDTGLAILVACWLAAFYGGVLLLAVALFRARRTPLWVPLLLVLFVALLPVVEVTGRLGSVAQALCLAVAFTATAIAAVNQAVPERADDGQP